MKNQDELLDDNWDGGPSYKTKVRRKGWIYSVITEYIRGKLGRYQKRPQTVPTEYGGGMDEPDGRHPHIEDEELQLQMSLARRQVSRQITRLSSQASSEEQSKKHLLSIPNTPRHPIQLMVRIIIMITSRRARFACPLLHPIQLSHHTTTCTHAIEV